ncbi:FtsX-like permease family protein [Actinomyces israelii]|uniref:FtsX-like permease family protein n=1 Tax=Actinomyces israelii TaxID=1659 RepID=UPI0005B8A09B|nr:ABC transporter permease [Actinomyces israelii]
MKDLALARLIIAGDGPSRRRLLGIVAGVMVGITVFLMLAAASQAFGERSRRSTWHQPVSTSPTYLEPDTVLTPATAAIASTTDYYGDRIITVVLVAATPDTRVRVPGSDVVPRPGQYVASPALAGLISSAPADQLGDRYGEQAGTLSDDAVEGPDSLVAVIGMDQWQILARQGSGAPPQVVTELVGYDYASQVWRIVAAIGAIAILVPVLLLIAIVTDLGAAQRAERFATLRLIGATPGQVARIAATETAATTLLGALLGVGAYLALIPVAARIVISSSRFFPRDLLASPAVIAATVLGTTLGASAVAWWRTRRAGIGPLGASRERSERPPRPLSLLPLLAGLAGLAAVRALSGSETPPMVLGRLLVGSFCLTMLGLLWAGPLLTSWSARLARRGARSAAQVISLGRLAQHPRAAFRAVGGLVVAVYAVTLFAVAITAAAGTTTPAQGAGYLSTTTLYATAGPADPAALGAAASRLDDVEGVRTVAVASMEVPRGSGSSGSSGSSQDQEEDPDEDQDAAYTRLVLSVEDARALGAADAQSETGWVSVSSRWLADAAADPLPAEAPGEGPAPAVLLVGTDGGAGALERARTAMETSDLDLTMYPLTRSDRVEVMAMALENQFAALGYIGILIAAGVSTASLAVSAVASLLARRRVLSLLRLVGMPRDVLRRSVAYETLLPVATVLALSIGAAVYTAWVLVTGTSSRSIDWPAGSYYAVVGACLALTGAAIAASARAAGRMVSGGTVRFE